MNHSNPIQNRLPKGALLVACVLSASWAQAAEPVSSSSTPLTFESVIDRYQAHEEQKVAPWREVNDTVREVGGWMAYAKEAQMPDPEEKKPEAMTDHSGMHPKQGGKQ